MRPLRYFINVTLDGCCDHRAMFADEDLHRHAVENLVQADALLFGRVTYEMMEAGWRRAGARPDWMEPFARTAGQPESTLRPDVRAHLRPRYEIRAEADCPGHWPAGGCQSSTLFPSGSMTQANFPYSESSIFSRTLQPSSRKTLTRAWRSSTR